MEDIVIISTPFTRRQLQELAEKRFGDLVKGVIDVDKEILALGGDLHADEEALLLQQGSRQEDLWGINLYPDLDLPEMLEFDSMINIRPRQNNRSRSVENEHTRKIILNILTSLIK